MKNKDQQDRIRDLGDFCLAWPELRSAFISQIDGEQMSDPAKETLRWLVALADQTCPFGPETE